MRLLLYEWCCSGGLRGPDATAVLGTASPAGLAAEGRLMLEALAADAVKLSGCEVTLLVDSLLHEEQRPRPPVAAVTREVEPGDELAVLAAAAGATDAVMLVAPETGGVLTDRLKMLERAGFGNRVIGGPERFAAAATDKQITCELLAAAGLPVPAGRSLRPGETLPSGFRLPAVVKARGSAGGDGLRQLATPVDYSPPTGPVRIESLAVGTPASVSCLCGPHRCLPLLPVEQRFSEGRSPSFRGIRPLATPLRPRASALAVRAIGAVARATSSIPRGWVGVDMILGGRPDGRDDRVLEVNPRLTTSFVGLSRSLPGGLIGPLLALADGNAATLGPWNEPACELTLP